MEVFKIHEDVETKEIQRKAVKNKEKKTRIPKKLVEKRTVLQAFDNGVRQESKRVKISNKENMPPQNEKVIAKKEEKHKPEIDSDFLKIVSDEDDINQNKDVPSLPLSRSLLYSTEYCEDIWKYYKEIEMSALPKPRYMDKHGEMNWSMRSILVDWLVCVADEYNMGEDTLFLAVNYIDRFFSRISVVREKIQLVGASAMLVAGKMEEIYPPMPKEWVHLTEETYTARQVIKMEQLLLKALEYKLQPPTIYTFVRQFCTQFDMDEVTTNLALYLSELVLLEGDHYLNYKPSEIAAAAIIYSRYSLMKPVVWPRELEKSSGYTVKHLSPIVKAQSATLKDSPKKRLQTIQEKYKTSKYGRVALLEPRPVRLEYLDESLAKSEPPIKSGKVGLLEVKG